MNIDENALKDDSNEIVSEETKETVTEENAEEIEETTESNVVKMAKIYKKML